MHGTFYLMPETALSNQTDLIIRPVLLALTLTPAAQLVLQVVEEEEEEEEEVVVEQARPASPFAGLFGGPKAAAAPAAAKEQPKPAEAPKPAPAAAPAAAKKEEAPARAASPFAGLFGGGATLQVGAFFCRV
jgi:hypothetical protein